MFDWILSLVDAVAFSFISPIYCQARYCGPATLLFIILILSNTFKLIKNKKRRFYYFSFFPVIILLYKIYQNLFLSPPSGYDMSFYSLGFETLSKYHLTLSIGVLLISLINIYLTSSRKLKGKLHWEGDLEAMRKAWHGFFRHISLNIILQPASAYLP